MWNPRGEDPRPFMLHRKMWEWLFIAQALSERDLLRPGHRGLGFGVGQEPLVALFASYGCDVVATDQPAELAQSSGWTDSAVEYVGGLAGLNDDGLCPSELFAQHVRYRDVDMNAIPRHLRHFDFTWSSCAFEHLGSLEAGMDFVVNQLRCLKPGGVAVHTTEYTVSSNDETLAAGGTVLYRRRDIDALVQRLRGAGHLIDVDFTEGTTPEDLHVDTPPYSDVHLRTTLGAFVTTSLALVIEKSAAPAGPLRALVRRIRSPQAG
jgi:SAM-dependent methyltransferase